MPCIERYLSPWDINTHSSTSSQNSMNKKPTLLGKLNIVITKEKDMVIDFSNV